MSHLYRAFNVSYLQFLRWIYKGFQDQVGLYTELVGTIAQVKENSDTRAFYDAWIADVKPQEDGVYDRNEDLLDKVDLFRRINMPVLYSRLVQMERESFWNNVTSLCRYCGMLSACGNQVGAMEDIAVNFVRSNPGLKPEQYHQKVFDEMLSGGDMSKNLLETFKKPGTLKSIVESFGSMLRAPGQKPIEMDGLLKMIDTEDLSNLDQSFAEVQSQIKASGVNPFDEVKAVMKEAGAGLSEADMNNPVEATMNTTSMMSDAVRRLTEKMMQQQQKKLQEEAEAKGAAAAAEPRADA